jgi:4-alpha-glucanotransferase
MNSSLPPFTPEHRGSGVLLHVTSLPSAYGIGDVGPAAFEWVDQLHEAGQRWWQSLPLGPTGCGNSPYSCLSSFAGNGLLVSPDLLIEDGLLRPKDCEAGQRLPTSVVDFDAVIAFKHRLLDQCWSNFASAPSPELRAKFEQFCFEQAHWLDEHALFRALKTRLGGAHLLDWPEDLLRRRSAALAHARRELAEDIEKSRFAQFVLSRQGNRLKEYAHERGVLLIGDLPFFVSLDSSDVWANPEWFQLDGHLKPRFVAGVPPDYFSAEGQLWGNPVYDWEALTRSSFRWCIDRFKSLLAHVDLIRLDHFRGFSAAWHVPPTAQNAAPGHWVSGPGAAFFEAVQAELGQLPFIAEDLGIITPDVVALRDQFNLPGIRVFQFGFDGNPDNPHLPHTYGLNTVAYTGTHDNTTTRDWYETAPEHVRQAARTYAAKSGPRAEEVAWEFIQSVWSSNAGVAIAPLQDLLNLGVEGRMNVPGVAAGNWGWRCTEEMLQPSIFEGLGDLTISTGRRAALKPELEPQKTLHKERTSIGKSAPPPQPHHLRSESK